MKRTSTMSRDDLKIKLAWQAAFELRTCPDAATLHASSTDEHLSNHLAICPMCRDRQAMPKEEHDAWKALRQKFLALSLRGALPEKTAGQIWQIDPALAGWNHNHYYVKPPAILLLGRDQVTASWRVVQLYADKVLMGNGDVALADRFGFAQAWNSYTVKESMLAQCLGAVTERELGEVKAQAALSHEPAERDSTVSLFRQLEVQIGSHLSVPAVFELVAEYEAILNASNADLCERIFGSVSSILKALAGWKLPERGDSIFDLISTAVAPQGQAPMSATGKSHPMPANHVRKKGEALLVEPLLTQITMDQWQGDGYLVSGTLAAPFTHPVQVLASLRRENGEQLESRCMIKEPATNFLLFFEDATEGESRLDHVQLLLVSYE